MLLLIRLQDGHNTALASSRIVLHSQDTRPLRDQPPNRPTERHLHVSICMTTIDDKERSLQADHPPSARELTMGGTCSTCPNFDPAE
jgi:hypothetical protein